VGKSVAAQEVRRLPPAEAVDVVAAIQVGAGKRVS
jgi:hypothetical protein